MLHCRSHFKIMPILLLIFLLLSSCKDISRDNILDPKNPASYRPQIISLEAFVNTENDTNYNKLMLAALSEIRQRYTDKMIIAQYHRNTSSFEDSLFIPESENIYEGYIARFDDMKGVPDLFINGATARIKGASSVEAAVMRIDDAIQPFLISNSYFTLEPQLSRNGNLLNIKLQIARLGTESAGDFYIRAVLIEQLNQTYYQYVVRHIQNSNLIPELDPGQQRNVDFSDLTVSINSKNRMIFLVIDNDELLVKQSIEVSVP